MTSTSPLRSGAQATNDCSLITCNARRRYCLDLVNRMSDYLVKNNAPDDDSEPRKYSVNVDMIDNIEIYNCCSYSCSARLFRFEVLVKPGDIGHVTEASAATSTTSASESRFSTKARPKLVRKRLLSQENMDTPFRLADDPPRRNCASEVCQVYGYAEPSSRSDILEQLRPRHTSPAATGQSSTLLVDALFRGMTENFMPPPKQSVTVTFDPSAENILLRPLGNDIPLTTEEIIMDPFSCTFWRKMDLVDEASWAELVSSDVYKIAQHFYFRDHFHVFTETSSDYFSGRDFLRRAIEESSTDGIGSYRSEGLSSSAEHEAGKFVMDPFCNNCCWQNRDVTLHYNGWRLLVVRPPVKLHKNVQIFYARERDDNSRGDTLGTEDLEDVVFDNFS